LRQIIQLLICIQILREARRLKIRIGLPEIVAGELRARLRCPGQESPTEWPVGENAQIPSSGDLMSELSLIHLSVHCPTLRIF
jgi:hypothetical protein